MKGLNLFLAACFFVPVLSGAVADTAKNTSRGGISRNTQTTTSARNTTTKQRTTKSDTTQNSISRAVQSRKNVQTQIGRSVFQPRNSSVAARTAALRDTPLSSGTSRLTRTSTSRAATVKTRESVMNRDFTKCKSVFFDCMDEFCANKDAQLKRCACSARTNEFKSTQKSLDSVEDNLLDFSQRLLKVNMDPADAAVINQASEGEEAYYQTKDKTASKKALNDIAKKLTGGFDSAENSTSGLALNWSLNTDSAFDSVDSLTGVATSAKSGTALRNAALPICRDMAAEVCDSDDISLVENSYNMAIEQDCNTVKKAYETKTQTARSKVLESSALLDMTRLSTYQDNNSDDPLQCRAKMLDMLSNTTVCGRDLTQCLDISGRYINPGTGEAFLTPDLVNFSLLITRPTGGNTTWASAPNNASFVSYLNNKKKFLKSATKNCQDIADDIWDDFVEDALAKIKLAQDAKLEEIRQSCTTLLSECLVDANQNLANFDSRALTTFGVVADKTANALCANVKTSCTNILAYNPENPGVPLNQNEWDTGTTQIAATETYHKIMDTCAEVGRGCIINACKSIMGNFGMCESITDSVNRHNILSRAACWPDVMACVNQATPESIQEIRNLLPGTFSPIPEYLYAQIYNHSDIYDSNNTLTVNDICANECSNPNSIGCYRCRIAEQIWGNCQYDPNSNPDSNKILIPTSNYEPTILSWFANNTHTQLDDNSCGISMCPSGTYQFVINSITTCFSKNDVVDCISGNDIRCDNQIPILSSVYNCCPTGQTDTFGNCCINSVATVNVDTSITDTNLLGNHTICSNTASQATLLWHSLEPATGGGQVTYIFCDGQATSRDIDPTPSTPPYTYTTCSGDYIMLHCNLDTYGNISCYYDLPTPLSGNGAQNHFDVNYYISIDAREITADNPNANPNNYCYANNDSKCPNSGNTYICTHNGTDWSTCQTPERQLIDFDRHQSCP